MRVYAFELEWKAPWAHVKQGSCLSPGLSSHLIKVPQLEFDKFEFREKNWSANEAGQRHCCQYSRVLRFPLFGSKSSLQFKWPACHAQLFNPIYFTQRARKFTRSHCAQNKLFMQPCLLQGGVDTVLVYYGSHRAALIRRGPSFRSHVFEQSVRFC